MGLSTKLVNMTGPFQLGPSDLVHILLVTRDNTYCFSRSGVKCQGHTLDIAVKPCKQDKDRIVRVRTIKLFTHTYYDKGTILISFQGQGSKVKVTC